MGRACNGVFYFSPRSDSAWDERDDHLDTYYDVDDIKRELGWNNIHSRKGYFEKLLVKHDGWGQYWAVLDWYHRRNGEEFHYRMFDPGSTITFLRTYTEQMPEKIKKKKEYWERAQAALEWCDYLEKHKEDSL